MDRIQVSEYEMKISCSKELQRSNVFQLNLEN